MNNKILLIKNSKIIKKIHLKDITHCIASGSYTEFYRFKNLLAVETKNIKNYKDKLLSENFIEVSRGKIINLSYINEIRKETDGTFIILSDYLKFKIAVRRIKIVRQSFIDSSK
ncbi:MAG: LytTR family transcriptional regulator DNA-binding domain-containing protein [Marinifilaceae bacterium]|jgi:DNA-binding LytR/AlgR family response regulator|nr:LytTR family transcriptional regulator DNA-binding domain-containing protein [Marinifilaceae bacterium]